MSPSLQESIEEAVPLPLSTPEVSASIEPTETLLPTQSHRNSFLEDDDIPAPELPHAPPPLSSSPPPPEVENMDSTSPHLVKKGLSPPVSPTGMAQRRVDVVSQTFSM